MIPEPWFRREIGERLAELSESADQSLDWPAQSWQLLCDAGVLEWLLPTEDGGQELAPAQLLAGYEWLAERCLTSAFILSQRESAVRRIRALAEPGLRSQLLRPLACGGKHVTVGISHLTTSGQHLAPAMAATPTEGGYLLDGRMPWVTAADVANHIVAAATLPDGLQLLVLLPTDAPGVRIDPPMPLLALRGSRTTAVHCEGVTVPHAAVLAGPCEKVLSLGASSTGGIETSCLALGLAAAALRYLQAEAVARPEVAEAIAPLIAEWQQLRTDMYAAVDGSTPEATNRLRASSNVLVLRATQTALIFAKGAGFVHPHPVQRWVRQAQFFLVWSCPRPALEATLRQWRSAE